LPIRRQQASHARPWRQRYRWHCDDARHHGGKRRPPDYLVAAAAPAVLPLFAARNKRLLLAGRTVPTATQRTEGD
jgi:hypothetical protein